MTTDLIQLRTAEESSAPRLTRIKGVGRQWPWFLMTVPALVLIAVFFLWPVAVMAARSVVGPAFTLEHYEAFFGSPVYAQVLGRTFVTAAIVTLLCLLIGYPYAFLMSTTRGWRRTLLLGVVLLPFWTSLLVRSIAWVFLLQDTGAINTLLIGMGLIDEPLPLIRNLFGVTIGMTQVLLPFLVLPLFATLVTIDARLLDASASLGARPWVGFWRVYFPLSLPGVVAGSLLVFVLSLGFYITPALLGGPADMMLGQLIVQQISQVLNWSMGATISMVLLACALALIGLVGGYLATFLKRAEG
jgi:putative spermidine/putrescine transport system permease protein